MLKSHDSSTSEFHFGNTTFVQNKPADRTIAREGTERIAIYVTDAGDCVQAAGAGPEWSNKPAVVASCAAIRLCEEVCMVALLETMPEDYCSLGTRQELNHLGPIAVGAEIEISALCTDARGRFSSWQVSIRDAHEIVGQGLMDFVAVHRAHYETRRLAPKHADLRLDNAEVLQANRLVNHPTAQGPRHEAAALPHTGRWVTSGNLTRGLLQNGA